MVILVVAVALVWRASYEGRVRDVTGAVVWMSGSRSLSAD